MRDKGHVKLVDVAIDSLMILLPLGWATPRAPLAWISGAMIVVGALAIVRGVVKPRG